MRPRPAVCCRRRFSWNFTAGAGAARWLAIAAILCLLLPSGTLRAELPPAGTDVLSVAVTLQITVDPGPVQMVPMIGQMTLRRGIGDPNQIPIEIISLNLNGMSPALGRVQATLDPHFASGGQVAMFPPTETPADSFFDVWFDISLPDMGRSFYKSDNIQSRTTAIPFLDVFSETFSERVSLIDQVTGLTAGSMTHVSLNPHPRINRLTTQAQVDIGRPSAPPGGIIPNALPCPTPP